MASNFREKEAFIIVYNMSSLIDVSSLELWFKKILESSNNKFSIILALGNTTDLNIDDRNEAYKMQQKIKRTHYFECPDCQLDQCNRIMFAECPISTGASVTEALRPFSLELFKTTPKFI